MAITAAKQQQTTTAAKERNNEHSIEALLHRLSALSISLSPRAFFWLFTDQPN